jgi:hypothetical protein
VDADKSQKIIAKMTLGDAKETVQVNAEGTRWTPTRRRWER